MLPDLRNAAAPGGRSGGEAVNNQPGGLPPTIATTTDGRADDTGAAVFFRNSYAVLVRGETVRRHLYFNLPAAERAVKRALARGDRADLVLVKLVPVDARHLDDREVV